MSVNWDTLQTALPGAPDVVALAAGLDTQVPVVLVPVRLETRFDAVEVPDDGDRSAALIEALEALRATLHRLAQRDLATTLHGTVKEKKATKRDEETKVYEAVESDIAAAHLSLDALSLAAVEPVVTGGKPLITTLTTLTASIGEDLTDARAALQRLRSEYHRGRLTAMHTALAARLERALHQITGRVVPGLRIATDLSPRRTADLARAMGKDPTGRPLRPESLPGRPPPRRDPVVLADGTDPVILGALTVLRLDNRALVDTAAAVEVIKQGLARGVGDVEAAAGLTVLPPRWKTDLLTAIATVPGADDLAAAVSAVPSGDPQLDASVPDLLRDVVFELQGRTRLEHRLLVRIYPEPLAIDSHEPGLTTGEETDALAYWGAVLTGGNDPVRTLGAWRALCVGRTTARAAWLAHVTAPPEAESSTPGVLASNTLRADLVVLAKRLGDLARASAVRRERLISAVDKAVTALADHVATAPPVPPASRDDLLERLRVIPAACESLAAQGLDVAVTWAGTLGDIQSQIADLADEPPPQPTLPKTDQRESTWTRAPTSRVLPERFAVVTLNAGHVTHVAQGKPVPLGLKLGLDPSAADGGFVLDENDAVVVDPAIGWLVNHTDAIDVGMAVTVPITAEEARRGFDEVFVVGLTGGDAAEGAERLAATLDAHHYTPHGLALVPIGTPTNNTETQQSGHTSTDDTDVAFPIERGTDLNTPGSDGARLAAALGIDPGHLAHIAGADGRDAADSHVATTALYAATIGHSIEELATSLMTLDARERLHAFVTGNLSARGFLPTIRVADQPYGILPATALQRFISSADDTPGSDAIAQERFDATLLGILRQMHTDWTGLRSRVKHARSPNIGAPDYDAQQHFLDMLALRAVSAAPAYRFAVNVARSGVRDQPDLSLSFGLPPKPKPGATAPTPSAADYGPWAFMQRFKTPLQHAFDVPDPEQRAPAEHGGGVAEAWRGVYDRLTHARAYEMRYLHGTKPLPTALTGDPTALASLASTSITELVNRLNQPAAQAVPLAERLVRHALLAESRRAALRILAAERLIDDTTISLAAASNSTDPTSLWVFLLSRLDTLDLRPGADVATHPFARHLGTRTLADYLVDRGTDPVSAEFSMAHQPVIDDLLAHADAVAALAALPTKRVDLLLREHLDLGGHRLDAWLTGLAQRRLDAMRAARPGGASVGAFGWIEDLRPDKTVPAHAALPPALAGKPGRPVVVDPMNHGFVQTPSPAHAVTAAVLLGGYQAQAHEETLGNVMSVNLSSGRVRTALTLIEGVRGGSDLGALLGYRLERFLHEYYANHKPPVEVDTLITPLRQAYPTVVTVDPNADAGPEPERNIVDGLAVIRTVLDWAAKHDPHATGTLYTTLDARGYPWGLAMPPAWDVDPGRMDALMRALDDLASTVDALADLVTAEAVHQMVRGNHTRAAAVLTALAEGKVPPTPEVAHTPHPGLPVTHRVVLQLDPAAPSWDAVPVTPRAALEPTVDAWLAALLGDPAKIRVRVRSQSGDAGPVAETSVADLGLRPLDLLAMLGPGYEAGLPQLVAHVLDHRRPVNLEPDQPGLPAPDSLDDHVVEPHRAPAWAPGIRSVRDVSVLLEAAADLLGRSRPATAADYAEEGATVVSGLDESDAAARASAARTTASATCLELAQLLADNGTLNKHVLEGDPRAFVLAHDGTHVDPETRQLRNPELLWGAREAWRAAVVAAARFGIQCTPPRRHTRRSQVCTELLQAAEAAFVELTTRLQAAPEPDDLLPVAQALFGDSVVVLPRVNLTAVRSTLDASFALKLASPATVDAWLEGAAAVRTPIRHLSEVLLLGQNDPVARVAQLPVAPKTPEPWLGGQLAEPEDLAGRVSVVVYGTLPPADTTGPALLVDEWTEVIPYRDRTTGVAVHYDQPDATAPQCVLVAVPPERGRAWELADLVATLHDTFEIARNRTVEPDHISTSLYGQILPLSVGEVVLHATKTADDSRILLDFGDTDPGSTR